MRGDLMRWILEELTPDPRPIGGILGVFFDYHRRGYWKKGVRRVEKSEKLPAVDMSEREKHRVRTVLSRLKKEGYLEIVDKKWKITGAGLIKSSELKRKTMSRLPPARYENLKSKSTLLIMFDIPEGERAKRAWLRSVLVNFGFIMLQRSVWVGKVKLPKEFLEDIDTLKISDYIQIIQLDKLDLG